MQLAFDARIEQAVVVRTVLALAMLGLVPSEVGACLHAPGGAEVQQNRQAAIIVHDSGVEDLIIQIGYRARNPSKLGWVVPVPSEPSAYATVSKQLFQDVERWIDLDFRSDVSEALLLGALGGVEELERHSVGPYDIQPIRARGEGGTTAVNEWLVAHGFTAIAAAPLEYYARRGWTFLVVQINPGPSGQLPAHDELPPLKITFATSRPVYPLKLSTHMGEFPATVYVFSRRSYANEELDGALDRGFGVLVGRRYLRPTDERRDGRWVTSLPRGRFPFQRAPTSLQPLLRRIGRGVMHLTVLRSWGVNATSRTPATVERRPAHWSEDLSIGEPMRLDAAALAN